MKIIYELPADDYHSISALSKSGLDQLAKSPMHFKHWTENRDKEAPTEAMRFGTAVHMAVLEPQKFALQYAKFTGDRRTKEGKAAFAEIEESGRTPLNEEQWNSIQGVAESVEANLWWQQNTKTLRTEVSCFHRLNDGIDLKARMDGVTDEFIVDIKTTQDASPAGFARSIASFRYHWQASFYRRFIDLPFVFIAVEKTAPYATGVYTIDTEALVAADADIDNLINIFRDCRAFGSMPGYKSEIVTLSLPKYVKPIEA